MGWKIVRDRNEAWCRANGVSGQWRKSTTPVAGLTRKLFEEAAEFAENGDPGELYDLQDVLRALLARVDPVGDGWRTHAAKVALHGGFDEAIEWCPVPYTP
jgi:predicted house-cleaning noncanonical NTP pyrophosphatase (MazG superfamily)